MPGFTEVKAAAQGQWPAIWAALGISDLPHPGRHGPCPGCGGRDRFRLVPQDADNGGWICGQGGDPTGGDGFALLVHCGIVRRPGDALRMVAAHLGLDTKANRRKPSEYHRRRIMEAMQHELQVLQIAIADRLKDKVLTAPDRQRERLAMDRIARGLEALHD